MKVVDGNDPVVRRDTTQPTLNLLDKPEVKLYLMKMVRSGQLKLSSDELRQLVAGIDIDPFAGEEDELSFELDLLKDYVRGNTDAALLKELNRKLRMIPSVEVGEDEQNVSRHGTRVLNGGKGFEITPGYIVTHVGVDVSDRTDDSEQEIRCVGTAWFGIG